MKIFISEIDRQTARRVALRNIARFFGIPDWENKDNNELLSELSGLKIQPAIIITNLLNVYFKAYDDWFSFYQKRKKIEDEKNEEYELNEKEHLELAELIKNREETLNALQEKFDMIQLQKLNKEKFGNNISGIIN